MAEKEKDTNSLTEKFSKIKLNETDNSNKEKNDKIIQNLSPEQKEDYVEKYIAYLKRNAAAKRRWYNKNKDRMREKQREIYHADVEKQRKRGKQYYAANKDKKKAYYEKNKDAILEKRKVRRRRLKTEKEAAEKVTSKK